MKLLQVPTAQLEQRIKEELAMGKTIRASIDAGFSRAMNAIVDSNLTTVLTCLVLFNFGSGPLQGFAVVLTMGIMASFFTNVFVVKVLMAAYYNKAEGSAISI